MSEPTRYSFSLAASGEALIEPKPEGNWVSWKDFDTLKQEHERVVADIKGAHRVLHDAGVRHLSFEENPHLLGLSARISLLVSERDKLNKLCVEIREDLKIRADMNKDDQGLVDLSNGLWVKLCETTKDKP